MERKILPYLVAISALSVSLSAAFYSVTGLGKMFAGASMQVIIMAGSLEVAKLVVASLLYQYWNKLGALLKIYLTIAVGVLMVITSGGIYGYLSSAYSETSTKLEVISKNVAVYDLKRDRFQIQLDDVTIEKQSLNQSILELTKGLSNNVIQYKDEDGNIITTTSRATRKALENQLNDAKQQRDKLSLREEALTDSITKIDLLKLDLETNTDIASEVGPLKYIANLTGKSMDQVVNWFIIALMLVFDPLAVALVISANVVFSKPKRRSNNRPDVKRATETASKLSEEHETDEEKPTALSFTSYYDDDIDEWEFDEEDALDQVLNNMVEEVEEETISREEEMEEKVEERKAESVKATTPPSIEPLKEKIEYDTHLNKVKEVEDLIEYIDNLGGEYKDYKIKMGYKIPITYLNTLGITKERINYIKIQTPPFQGRIIIENDMCIIEHPDIYNKVT